MLLPFPRKLSHAAITDPGSSPSTSTNTSTSETILFFIPSSMFPAYFACLPGNQAPAFEAFRKQKSCRTQSVQQPFFCANCMPAAFSRSAAYNHLAGLLTHTSGASPASLRSLLGFPMTGFRLCAQTRAYSAGRRLFYFPFPLSAYSKAPASRHKMAVSYYQIHYTVRPDICKV